MGNVKINQGVKIEKLLCEFYIAADGDLYILATFRYRKNPFESEEALTWVCEKDFIFE